LRIATLAACVSVTGAAAAPPAGAAGPIAWSPRVTIEGNDTTGNFNLRAVSCPTANLCATTDSLGNAFTSTNPGGGAAAWHGKAIDASNALRAISCLPSLCVAGDSAGNVVTTNDPAATSPTWSAPVLVDSGHSIMGISCPATSLCVAVDNAGNVLTSTDPTGGAGQWSAPGAVDAGHGFNAVSCPSVSFCVAVDNHGSSASTTTPTGTWTLHAGIDATRTIDSVSCPSSTLCLAVDETTSGNFNGAVLSSTTPASNTAWKSVPVEFGANNFDELVAVSCASSSLCVVVDDGGHAFASTNPTGGSADWKTAFVDPRWSLLSVSCASLPLCVAGDQGGNVVVGRLAPPDTTITLAKVDQVKHSANFRFKALGLASGFQCALRKNGAPAPFRSCASPKLYKPLAPGNYAFLVRAFNSSGPDPSPALYRFRMGPPDTTITKAKVDKANRAATFRFKAVGPATGFKCALKKGSAKASFSKCTSPKSYTHLAPGSYRFMVKAVNAVGADKTPASKPFSL
jgi:hypothetical protein